MAKKRSAYENEYTKQLEEAVFDQKGYDDKKAEHKKKMKAETNRHKGLVRIFMFLCLLGFFVAAKYILDLDPDNAGPLTVFVSLVAVVAIFVKWLNK
jgi:hypothetical protein